MDENTIKTFISDQIDQKFKEKLGKSFDKKIGDIPTDALQLVPKKYVDQKIYAGYVNADGSAGKPFPSGWTVVNSSTAAYTITHNLGTTNYSILVTALYNNDGVIQTALFNNKAANSVGIIFFVKSGGNSNCAFSFAISIR